LLTVVTTIALALAGCAAPSMQESAAAQSDKSRWTITGSRIPIRDTVSAIGVKTVDQDELDKMKRNSPGRSN
jgi:hypothetical protein